jgi:putative ABC transport system permease protein
MQMLLREGFVLCFVGALVGLPLGWLLAHGLARGMESAFAIKLAPAELAVGPSLFAFVMGPVLATLAAYWPARRAGQIQPLENLRQGASDRTESAGSKTAVVGVVLLVLSVTGMFLSWAKLVSQQVALTVAIFFLIGLLLLLPRVLQPLYDLVYRLVRFVP